MPNKLTAEELAAKERRATEARRRFAMAQREARMVDEERERRRLAEIEAERASKAVLCAEAKAVLDKEGWKDVAIEHRAFYTVRGNDPQSLNHSAAGDDLDALVLHMMEAGAPPPPRRPAPEPETPGVMAPAPAVIQPAAPVLTGVMALAPPEVIPVLTETAEATLDDRAFPLMSDNLRAAFRPGETFRQGHARLTVEMQAEYDRMMQLVLSQAGKRIVDDATAETADDRRAKYSRLRAELAEIGNRLGLANG